MNRILAFADEYGNNSFDVTSQGTHFIVASVIVNENNLNNFEKDIEIIRKKYFQTGEIKSKKVADDHKRRTLILKALCELEFNVYALVVDKKALTGEGFKYKQSFYKYVNGLLYRELYKAYPKLKLYVDEHGGNDFLTSFKKYVQKNHIRDLFSGSEFETGDSKNSQVIQVADFIAGTLGRCYDLTKNTTQKDKFLDILKPRLSSINYFPKPFKEYKRDFDDENEFDEKVSEYATNVALDFLETKIIKKPEHTDQLNCLKLLLLHQTAFGSSKFLAAEEIINHLSVGRDKKLNAQQFRSTVIGKLRDQGILIASSSKGDKKGYRLPTNIRDLILFLEHGNSLVLPILKRMKICREKVKLATNNGVDVLANPDFDEARKIIENL